MKNIIKSFYVIIAIIFYPFISFGQKIVTSISSIKNIESTNVNETIYLNDGLNSGNFYFSKSVNLTDDDALIIKSNFGGFWVRIYDATDGINIGWFGAKCDGKTDDSHSIQRALDHGGVIKFPPSKIIRVINPLFVKKHRTIINGNGSDFIYDGNGAFLSSNPEVNNVFPVRVVLADFNIILNKPYSSGIQWKFSSSSMSRISIALKNTNQVGVEIVGDNNGTGSYYNSFNDIFIQGGNHLGFNNNFGWKFVNYEDYPTRNPNANSWNGGRVGQCDVAMFMNGYGNVVNQLTIEGCKTGFKIGYSNNRKQTTAHQNKILNCYFEKIDLAFDFGPYSRANIANLSYMTGVKQQVLNKGTNNKIE